MKRFALAVALSLCATHVGAQDVSSGSSFKYGSSGGSVYSNYGSTVFVRGSYAFSGRIAGVSGSVDAPGGAVGIRWPLRRSGRSTIGVETELFYLRDSESALLAGSPVNASAWGLTGLVGFRWDLKTDVGVNPFMSVGIGPSYQRAKGDVSGVTFSVDDFTFAYSGRAGATIDLSDRLALETAYRYLGTSQAGTPGVHAGEIGLNLNF